MTATCRRNLVPTFVGRGVSRGQRGGSPTAANLSFLDRNENYTYIVNIGFTDHLTQILWVHIDEQNEELKKVLQRVL
jgi:hypothetical protein